MSKVEEESIGRPSSIAVSAVSAQGFSEHESPAATLGAWEGGRFLPATKSGEGPAASFFSPSWSSFSSKRATTPNNC
eukprot:scaffold46069_cov31-Tisochrysis_lutea.AAC.5